MHIDGLGTGGGVHLVRIHPVCGIGRRTLARDAQALGLGSGVDVGPEEEEIPAQLLLLQDHPLDLAVAVAAARVLQATGLDEMQSACDTIGYCPCGSAVVTPAFALNAGMVVHAVGPVWIDGAHGEVELLVRTYDSALSQAFAHDAHRIALPFISAGTYGFPPEVSLEVAREAIRTFLDRHEYVDVRLVLYDRASVAAGMASYADIAEYIDDNYVDARPMRASQRFGAAQPEASASPASSKSFFGSVRERFRRGDGARPGASALSESATPREAAAPSRQSATAVAPSHAPSTAPREDLENLLDRLGAPFSDTLLALIDARGLNDARGLQACQHEPTALQQNPLRCLLPSHEEDRPRTGRRAPARPR